MAPALILSKVSLERSYAHLFMCHQWEGCLHFYGGPQSLKYLQSGPLQEKSASP